MVCRQRPFADEQAEKLKKEESTAQRLARILRQGLCSKCESDNVVGENYRIVSGRVGNIEHSLELETRICLDCGYEFEVSL